MTTTDKQEAAIYRGSKMAISLSHYDLERYFSDRMLRIMGCSTLCLAKWYPGIEKDFTDGVHLVVWRDIQELITKIHYYMDHPKERFIIARGGHLRVGLEHTWSIRIGQLQKIIYDNPKIPHVEKKVKVFKFLRL
jgi:spore maturation protein CgeB